MVSVLDLWPIGIDSSSIRQVCSAHQEREQIFAKRFLYFDKKQIAKVVIKIKFEDLFVIVIFRLLIES